MSAITLFICERKLVYLPELTVCCFFMEILNLEFSLIVIKFKIIHQLMSHTFIKTRVITVFALPVNQVESLILNNDGSLRQCD